MEGVSLEIRTVLGEKLGLRIDSVEGTELKTNSERRLEKETCTGLRYRKDIELQKMIGRGHG